MKKILFGIISFLFFSIQANASVPVSSYIFNQSIKTYTSISGGTLLASGSYLSGWVSSELSIPLFTFGGFPYSTAYVSTNGLITLGGSAPTGGTTSGISTGSGSGICICPFNTSLKSVGSSTTIRWQTVGNEIVFQWAQVQRNIYNLSESFDFQVRLNTLTGAVIFVYKLNSTPYAESGNQPQVGIRTSIYDYNNRLVTTSVNWNSSLPGTSRFDVCRFDGTSPATNFTTGLTYSFTPLQPCATPALQPASLSLTAGVQTIAGAFPSASGADSYLVVHSLSPSLSANPVNGTNYTVGDTLGGGVVDYCGSQTNWTTTGLPANTTFYFFVFSANSTCTGGPKYLSTSPRTGSKTTNTLMTYNWVATTGNASWITPGSWSPARNTADPTDILVFNRGGNSNATNVPAQTIGRIIVGSNTTINLQASVIATLTINSDGSPVDELSIESGSTLKSNGTTASLTITYGGTGSTGTIAGIMEVTSASGSVGNVFNFTGGTASLTNVTGVLANGQSGGSGTPVITSSAATLIFSSTGIYNHNFTTISGSIPRATWSPGSTIQILGFTTATSSIGNINQPFSNFIWNCPNQGSTNIGLNSNMTISGTFSLVSTGNTGTLCITRMSNSYTLAVLNYSQTGGSLNLSSSTGNGTLQVGGIFHQTGGLITETGTATANTINFNGSTNQSVTFNGTHSSTLSYRISNNAGITLTGIMAITTGASLIISSTSATPIQGGTLTYSGTSTLEYNSTSGNQTITANEFPLTGGPANLTINAPGLIVSIPFDRSIEGILKMSGGDINMESHTLTLGSGVSSMGTLSYNSGCIIGNFKRWVNAAIGSTDFPVGIAYNTRKAVINYTTAPTAGGTLTAKFIQTDPGVAGLPLTQGSITVDNSAKDGYWKLDPGDGLSGGTYTGTFTATNFPGINSYSTLVLIKRQNNSENWVLEGVHVATTGSNAAPVLSRTGITTGASEFCVGGNNSNNPMAGINIFSVMTGPWGDGATWNTGFVPTSTDFVSIMNGHTVSQAGSGGNTCNSLNIAVSGTLASTGNELDITGLLTCSGTINISAGVINVAGSTSTGVTVTANTGLFDISGGTFNLGPPGGGKTTFTVSGTLSVSGSGTLNLNGNLYTTSGSVFNQLGGNINIDGNAGGVAANSSSTYLLNLNAPVSWAGGTLTIVDPSAMPTATYSIYYFSTTSSEIPATHTLRFGDGFSSDAGGNVCGFFTDVYPTTGKLNLGTVIVNGPGTGTASVTNRRWTISTHNNGIRGNLVINNKAELSTGIGLCLAGDLTVNPGGTLTHTGGIFFLALPSGTTSTANPNAQYITNNGTVRNLSSEPTANFYAVTINNNNANGITLNSPFSISSELTLTEGKVNTTSINRLQLGTATAAGSLYMGTATAYIDGPFARTFNANTSGGGFYLTRELFPVGRGSTYLPINISPTTSSGGSVIMSGQAFTSNPGTLEPGYNSLSDHRWEALIAEGSDNLTVVDIQIADPGVSYNSKIVQATSPAGQYQALQSTYIEGATPALSTYYSIPPAAYTGYFSLGKLDTCPVPPAQPSSLVASYITTSGFVCSWSPPSPSPDKYLVVRYPAGTTAVSNPIDFMSFSVGSNLGYGKVRFFGADTLFEESGLTSGLTYDFYIYACNNNGCYGPIYNTASPLSGSVSTCTTAVGTPGAPSASLVTNTGMKASWTASSTPGVVYFLDVATNTGFTTFVPGYYKKNVGTNLTETITGLTGNTTYYLRVQALNQTTSCCSNVSGTRNVTTACDTTSAFPITETFNETTFPPLCWKKFQGLLGNPSVLNTTTVGWTQSRWLNVANSPDLSAELQIDESTTNYWMVTPFIDLGAGFDYKLSFDMALVDEFTSNPIWNDPNGLTGIDDKFAVVISTDGTTWSSVNTLRLWDNAGSSFVYNEINYLGERIEIPLAGYSGIIRIGFYGESTLSNAFNELLINNFELKQVPTSWTGLVSDSWDNPDNWGGHCIPASGADITIPLACPNYPLVAPGTSRVCHNMYVIGTVNVSNTSTLTVTGTLEISGSLFVEQGGTLITY